MLTTVESSIGAKTLFCAVYGHPVRHSASPAMQNAGIQKLGLDWRYLAFDVNPDLLAEALAGAKAMKFVGLNLTVPHKLLAVPFMDHLDESARTWGAVNTVRFEARKNGEWTPNYQADPGDVSETRSVGYNTDADAVVRAIREDLSVELAGRAILLLGAGGAGRVAALRVAQENPSELFLVNRTMDKALAVAREIRGRFPQVRVTVGYPSSNIDLLINATSAGLNETDPLPFDTAHFKLTQANAVYDMIYRPAKTRLLREAEATGIPRSNGLGMLLYQGAKALEIWTGESAPIQEMRDALWQNVYGHRYE